MYTTKLDFESREKIKDAAAIIAGSFQWAATDQGWEYWNKVEENLRKLAEEQDILTTQDRKKAILTRIEILMDEWKSLQ